MTINSHTELDLQQMCIRAQSDPLHGPEPLPMLCSLSAGELRCLTLHRTATPVIPHILLHQHVARLSVHLKVLNQLIGELECEEVQPVSTLALCGQHPQSSLRTEARLCDEVRVQSDMLVVPGLYVVTENEGHSLHGEIGGEEEGRRSREGQRRKEEERRGR